jgi:hypothetical protein
MPAEPEAVHPNSLLPAINDTSSQDLASLLAEFGGNDWDIAWLDDGRLGARPRHGDPRPAGPFALIAKTPAEMRHLLRSAPLAPSAEPTSSPGQLTFLSEAISSALRCTGLTVTERAWPGQAVELLIASPENAGEGRVLIDHHSLIEWDRRSQATDQLVAAHIASVVISILARQ